MVKIITAEEVPSIVEIRSEFRFLRDLFISEIDKNEQLDIFDKLKLFETDNLMNISFEIDNSFEDVVKEITSDLCKEPFEIINYSLICLMLDNLEDRQRLYNYALENKTCFLQLC